MEGKSILHVPESREQFKPFKPVDLITQATQFLDAHWEEVKPFYKAISGEAESIHGSVRMDEAGCVFEIQRLAGLNGYPLLATVKAAKLRLALRRGYKRLTGTPVHALEKQNIRLRLEYRQAVKEGRAYADPEE